MKNQVTYQTNLVSESMNLVAEKIQNMSFRQLLLVIRQWVLATRPFTALAHLCSLVLEEEVSALKAFNLLHAFVAFVVMIMMLGYGSLLLQVVLVAWFGMTFLICKKDGWNDEGC